jgi:hypothetical protein
MDEEEVFRMLKDRPRKAKTIERVPDFFLIPPKFSGISGYWGNNHPFQKSLWHPRQQTVSQVSFFFFLDLALLPSLA